MISSLFPPSPRRARDGIRTGRKRRRAVGRIDRRIDHGYLDTKVGSVDEAVELAIKMRDERKKLLAEQSAKLDALGKKDGVTQETLTAIREALGIV